MYNKEAYALMLANCFKILYFDEEDEVEITSRL
jgi:hypothetical protein